MTEIILILIAWFVDMPLWLSIGITVYCGILVALSIVKVILERKLKKMEKELKEKLRSDWHEKV